AALATPTRIVTGLFSNTFHTEIATAFAPSDLTSTTFKALVPNASGGVDTFPGVGHSDGTLSISGVPVGNYWLAVGSNYIWTSADHVEWVFDSIGRIDLIGASIS